MAKKKPSLSLGSLPPAPLRPTLSPDEEAAAAAFVAGKSPRDRAAKRANAEASKRLGVGEPKHLTWERFTLYLPHDVAKALRHKAVDTGLDLSDVTAAALRAWLKG